MVSHPSDFEQMMRASGPRVYTLAVRLAGNVTDGQDLAQETFVKAYEHWESFRGESEVATWLYRICVNCWKNRMRYERRRAFWKHFSLDGGREDENDPVRDLPSGEPPVSEPLERTELEAQVQAALAKLQSQDRAILVLREMEEKSYEEIAELLDVPIGTVRSRLSRAREKLAQEFMRLAP